MTYRQPLTSAQWEERVEKGMFVPKDVRVLLEEIKQLRVAIHTLVVYAAHR